MSAPLGFWFEFASSYSYPAAMRIGDAAAAAGVALSWQPFLLGPIFAARGWRDSPFNIYPDKGRYMWRDLERICAAEGLPLARPARFPANSLLAARVAVAGAGAAWLPGYVRAVYAAGFGRGADIADPAVLAEALAEAGAPAALLEAAEDPAVKGRLRAQTAAAEACGIFGAPSFTVGEGAAPELFWGHDRMADAIAWAGQGEMPHRAPRLQPAPPRV
ncbi:2-hydroxychromene-2-carboxylate isomerase [Paralimibaculum aggregatum]|uniref:2-hydroxychromene-2-carboxylate isomerase n=1 Tax=Paralimibaculum aggregatum TaxID=3036245 RepID=A0ABQ6LH97_9RHOB|nr:DsbA family protein [Limibaculum sp. NKW23]GMG81806.1 2-hydroxychromene-2-carboxylate isomerase [Limibaculum sp. NKW23]